MAKRKNGEGTWGTKAIKGKDYQFFRDANGKYFYGKTQKEIRQKVKEYEEQQQARVMDGSALFGDYVMTYLENKRLEIEATTYDGYENVINNMLKPYTISNCTMSALTEDNMRSFIEELIEKYAKGSIDKLFRIVKPALVYAVEHNDIAQNPMDHVKVPSESHMKIKKKDIPFIIQSDLDKLYKECKRINVKGYNWGGKIGEPTYGNNAYAVVLIGNTGLRISELIGLRWKDIDLDKKKLYVKNAIVRVVNRDKSKVKTNYTTKEKDPKSDAGVREIPLSDIALEMLDYFDKQNPKHTPDDYVVLNVNGKHPNQRNVQRTLDAMLIRGKCSVEHCSLHGLRHGFGAILLSNGVDIKIVSKLLGHAKISTTYDIYINFTRDQVENAVISTLNKKVDADS